MRDKDTATTAAPDGLTMSNQSSPLAEFQLQELSLPQANFHSLRRSTNWFLRPGSYDKYEMYGS